LCTENKIRRFNQFKAVPVNFSIVLQAAVNQKNVVQLSNSKKHNICQLSNSVVLKETFSTAPPLKLSFDSRL